MELSGPLTILIPAVGGGSFALMGLAYRLGEPRRVSPAHIIAVACVAGAAMFGIRSTNMDWSGVPLLVWALGVAAGLSQYGVVHAVSVAIRRGPLSPMWCALMLGFAPVILISRFALDEPVRGLQLLAVAIALACVLVASRSRHDARNTGNPAAEADRPAYLSYVLLLLAILLLNSALLICVKVLGSPLPGAWGYGDDLVARFSDAFYLAVYVVLGALAWADVLRSPKPAPVRPLLALGLLAGLGSVGGMTMLNFSAHIPAAVFFPVSGIVSILTASVASVLFFGERPGLAWGSTVALGVVAVLTAAFGAPAGG